MSIHSLNNSKRIGRRAAAFVIAMTGAVLSIFTAEKANAQSFGCAFGGFGAYMSGPEIVGIGTTGQLAGVAASCGTVVNKVSLDAEISYAFVYGDTKDLVGVENELRLSGLVGYMITPRIKPYVHLDWVRLSGGDEHVDGYGYGVGTQFHLDGSVWADVRWTHDVLDFAGSPVDITSDTIRVGLNFKFGAAPEVAKSLK